MAGLSPRCLALTGVPRGGTTLACHLLAGCDDTVALFEPMDVRELAEDRLAALAKVEHYFDRCRTQALATGTAPSKQLDGRVPDNPFAPRAGNAPRRLQATPGEVTIGSPLSDGFLLAIKHNAAFAALLPELAQRLPTRALVRHPLAVLASWNSVDLPVREGRIPAGERLDGALRCALDAEPDRLRRQLRVLDWFFARFAAALPAGHVLRYEDIVATSGRCLFDSVGAVPRRVPVLRERNASGDYRLSDPASLADALLRQGGEWERWYPRTTIVPLLRRMQGAGT